MLNDVITIDLHIHSKASSYKESGGCVSESDVGHIDVLLERLNEKNVALFSITDHNRFDSELYAAIESRLLDDDAPCKAVLIPGVEFDVALQAGKTPAHIIAIFNNDDADDLKQIEASIEAQGRLEGKSDSYSLEDFEKLLKRINRDVILIAHQHSGFNGTQKPRSLGKATDGALDYYEFGYIDALECNSSKVQGILRGELADLRLPGRMVMGSDCHDWRVYPRHDLNDSREERPLASIRALPSFRGLLMALTSPEFRIGIQPPESKAGHFKSVSLLGKDIPLSPGLNVIIGENGSGKSSLLSLLCESGKLKKHVARIQREYDFSFVGNATRPIYIKQGDLQDKYGKGEIFDQTLFSDPDHVGFSSLVRSYAESIKESIKLNIAQEALRTQARNTNILIETEPTEKIFSFPVAVSDSFAIDDNPWDARVSALQSIETMIGQEVESSVYDTNELSKLKKAQELIAEVRSSAYRKRKDRFTRTEVKGVLFREFSRYSADVHQRASDVERARIAYQREKLSFIEKVIELAREEGRPDCPIKSSTVPNDMGITRKQHHGFTFVRAASYSKIQDFSEEFLSRFNSGYRSLDALLGINTKEGMEAAIPGRIPVSWEQSYDGVVQKTIDELCSTSDTILDSGDKATGNTLGERALTYYKFKSFDIGDSAVFVVDQPEDNISNQRIAGDLIGYFNELRKRVQLIIVTHNPLLVVNLDADNVIALATNEQTNQRAVVSGCLESRDDGSVLREVANIMDGGKEAIMRRMKAYGSVY